MGQQSAVNADVFEVHGRRDRSCGQIEQCVAYLHLSTIEHVGHRDASDPFTTQLYVLDLKTSVLLSSICTARCASATSQLQQWAASFLLGY
jgi:hypothetical protein